MIKAVLFDMDGVLVDSEPLYYRRKQRFLKEQDLLIEDEVLLSFVGRTIQDLFSALFQDPQMIQQMKASYQHYQYEHPIAYDRILRPEVKPVLQQLHAQGIRCGLASASPRNNIKRMLESCDLSHAFDAVVCSEDVLHSKPYPDVYLKVMELLHLAAQECLVIEDSPTGILAATAAGCQVLALQDHQFAMDQSKANHIIDSLTAIMTYLK